MGKTQTTAITVAFEGQDAKMNTQVVHGITTMGEEVSALLKWGNREELISKGGSGFTSRIFGSRSRLDSRVPWVKP